MLFEIRKAVQALHRPGIDTKPWRMLRNAAPYYLPGDLKVSAPLTIYWSINSVCNLRCKMCYYSSDYNRKKEEMDLPVFRKIAEQVFPKTRFLYLSCATEPTMNRHLDEIVRSKEVRAAANVRVLRISSNFLLPRWCGDVKAHRDYAEYAAEVTKNESGDALYALVAWDAFAVERDPQSESAQLARERSHGIV